MRKRIKRGSLVGFLLVVASAFNWTAVPAFTDQPPAHGPVLAFSTYLGGGLVHYVNGIAVDSLGNTYVAGSTNSSDFPTTPGAFQTAYAGKDAGNGADVFVTKLGPDGGKNLIVFGENFSDGAAIVLNRDSQKTSNDAGSPTGMLIGKKSGKRIGRGQSVTIQVSNSDGVLSEPFSFTRPID